jgi:hypothetical protein
MKITIDSLLEKLDKCSAEQYGSLSVLGLSKTNNEKHKLQIGFFSSDAYKPFNPFPGLDPLYYYIRENRSWLIERDGGNLLGCDVFALYGLLYNIYDSLTRPTPGSILKRMTTELPSSAEIVDYIKTNI